MDSNGSEFLVACRNANEGYAAHGFDPVDGVLHDDALDSCTACDAEAKLRCPTCGTVSHIFPFNGFYFII